MIYTKLVSEVSKLYDAFHAEFSSHDESLALTKICLREFPIFREMIEEEPVEIDSEPNKKPIGYIRFTNGTLEAIYDVVCIDPYTCDYYTDKFRYRATRTTACSYRGNAIYNTYRYARLHLESGKEDIVHDIKDIELIKEGLE